MPRICLMGPLEESWRWKFVQTEVTIIQTFKYI